jgi:eukaryotic-like serine/threonine-protein kinase
MGEVYRARDTKLNRDVTIKVLLPPSPTIPTGSPASSVKRRCLPRSIIPNVGHIYGFEDTGGMHALVLEFVAGQTLGDRIEGLSLLTRRYR